MKPFFKFYILSMFIFVSCSSESQLIKTYKIVYEPVKEQNLISYYVSGLPLGASSINNLNIIFNLQPTEILGDEYLRLWFFIENNSGQEVLFEPSQEFKMFFEKGNSKFEVNPESPLKILEEIEEEKQVNLITQTIAAALKSVGTTNTTITDKDKDTQLEVNDVNEKIEKTNSDLNKKLSNVENWYDLYSESFNQGVLRKNTLFANQSVNGYIYFKIDLHNTEYKTKDWGYTKKKYKVSNKVELKDLKDYNIYLKGLKLLIGSNVKFVQVKGE